MRRRSLMPGGGHDFVPIRVQNSPMQVSRRKFVIAASCLAALSPGPAFAQNGSAMEFMNRLAGQVGVLVDDRNRPEAARRREFQVIFNNASDNREMARFAIGRYWAQLDDAQRRQYMALFPVYMAGYYWKTFNIYYGSGYAVLSQRTDASGTTIVHSQIELTGERPAIDVDWHIVRENGAFKIVDVDLMGLSQNLSYRDYFANLIEHNGGDVSVVLDTMRQHPNG